MKRIFPTLMAVGLVLGMASQQAISAQDLVIGQVASLSGTNGADLGQGLQLGLQLAVEKTNAAGGINGRKLKLITKDDKYIPDETVKLTKELISEANPIALAGYRGTANTLAVIKSNALTDAGIAMVGTLTGAKEVQGAANIYHVRTSYQHEIGQIVEQLGRMGVTKIGLFYVDDAFGQSGKEAVEQVLVKQSRQPAAMAAYDKAADKVIPSIEQAVKTLVAAQPQAVVIVAVGDPVYEFIKRFRALAPSPRLVSISVVNPDAVTQKVGLKMAHGIGFSQVFPYPYTDSVKLVREYRVLLKKHAPNAQPSYFSLEGYISGLVLAQAIRNAGSQPTRAKVLEAMQKMDAMDLGGFALKFDPVSKNGSKFTELTVISQEGILRR
ncbi:ABC transporter substrate-binding protein [Variovorax sp. PCZ-1]|uniref:ABC transporter substrate-binding protein n=1 Tax=Variovorax sp. PCZ-1 TaxID=2835533 RepID=UPI001BCB6777|nr:ABC transporter substrate-binding protein [Variovorax sp. PCZ-1]MBS7808293.1 ABC transporter substrate-binding protein [Variovorax sp. PCZ-1]